MSVPAISAAGPALLPDRAALREAAQGFEAIFIRRMLEAARASDFGNALTAGAGTEQFTAMRDAHLADIAAQRGAFGIAAALEAQLARHLPAPAPKAAD